MFTDKQIKALEVAIPQAIQHVLEQDPELVVAAMKSYSILEKRDVDCSIKLS